MWTQASRHCGPCGHVVAVQVLEAAIHPIHPAAVRPAVLLVAAVAAVHPIHPSAVRSAAVRTVLLVAVVAAVHSIHPAAVRPAAAMAAVHPIHPATVRWVCLALVLVVAALASGNLGTGRDVEVLGNVRGIGSESECLRQGSEGDIVQHNRFRRQPRVAPHIRDAHIRLLSFAYVLA